MKKLMTMLGAFLLAVLLIGCVSSSSTFLLDGHYKAKDNSVITDIYFEKDKVVVSYDLSKGHKNLDKITSGFGPSSKVGEKASNSDNNRGVYLTEGEANYDSKYGKTYVIFQKPLIKKVDNTWKIATENDVKTLFLLDVKDSNSFKDEQNVLYEKVN